MLYVVFFKNIRKPSSVILEYIRIVITFLEQFITIIIYTTIIKQYNIKLLYHYNIFSC